jgi:hypothetical protein
MNKLTTIALFSLLINSLSFATIIYKSPAQQLYGLLKVTPKNIDGASVKDFGQNWQCQEKQVVNGSPFIVYEYQCVVPDPGADGRIHLGQQDGAKALYEELGRLRAAQTLKTNRNMNILMRTLGAVECREQDYLVEQTEYKCSIKP